MSFSRIKNSLWAVQIIENKITETIFFHLDDEQERTLLNPC